MLNNQQIGKTGFYAKSADTFSNLTYQNYPKTFNDKTRVLIRIMIFHIPLRLDLFNLIRMWGEKKPITAVPPIQPE